MIHRVRTLPDISEDLKIAMGACQEAGGEGRVCGQDCGHTKCLTCTKVLRGLCDLSVLA